MKMEKRWGRKTEAMGVVAGLGSVPQTGAKGQRFLQAL
jgi:hypothetical protein